MGKISKGSKYSQIRIKMSKNWNLPCLKIKDAILMHYDDLGDLTDCTALRQPYAEPWKLPKKSKHSLLVGSTQPL